MTNLKLRMPDGATLLRSNDGIYAIQITPGHAELTIPEEEGDQLLRDIVGPMELDYIAKALHYDNLYLDEQENIVWQRLVRAGLARIKPAHSLDMAYYVINAMGKRLYKELKQHVR